MEFTADVVNGKVIVKPIIVKKDNDITIHVPSFNLISKLKEKFKKEKK